MIRGLYLILIVAFNLPIAMRGEEALETVFRDPAEDGALVHRLVRGSRASVESGFTLTGSHEEFLKAKRHGPAVFYENLKFTDGELSFDYMPVSNSMLVVAFDTVDEGQRYHLAKVQFVDRGLMITSFERGEKGVPAKGRPKLVGAEFVPEKEVWVHVALLFSGDKLIAKVNDSVFESTAPSFGEVKHQVVLTTNIGDASFRKVALKVPDEKKVAP